MFLISYYLRVTDHSLFLVIHRLAPKNRGHVQKILFRYFLATCTFSSLVYKQSQKAVEEKKKQTKMEKLTFLLHIVVFIACAYPSSSSTLLNDRSFEISNLPSSRAEKLIRELNLFPKLDVNVIDVTDSTLASAEEEEVPSIVERSFRFPNIVSDGGATVEDLGHHAGYFKLPKSQGARFISNPSSCCSCGTICA